MSWLLFFPDYKKVFGSKGLISSGKKKIFSSSWAGAVNADFIQSGTYIVFCRTAEDLDGEAQGYFT